MICGADNFECQSYREMVEHMKTEHGYEDARAEQDHYNTNRIAELKELIRLVETGQFDIKVMRTDNERARNPEPEIPHMMAVSAKVIRIRLERNYKEEGLICYLA